MISSDTNEDSDDDEKEPLESGHGSDRRAMLAMAVCISANIGGTATIIGAAPNVVCITNMDYFEDHPLTFTAWMGFALPAVAINLFIVWAWLGFYYLGVPNCLRRKSKR